MKASLPTKILVGKMGRPHGIKGYIKLHSYTDPVKNILNYIKKPELPELLDYKLTHNHIILVLFQDYDSPEKVRKLVNQKIWINRSDLPELETGQYYWADLIGLDVYNINNHYLGKITELMTINHQNMILINKNILIPYINDKFVININLNNNTMQVNWDLDLNNNT